MSLWICGLPWAKGRQHISCEVLPDEATSSEMVRDLTREASGHALESHSQGLDALGQGDLGLAFGAHIENM